MSEAMEEQRRALFWEKKAKREEGEKGGREELSLPELCLFNATNREPLNYTQRPGEKRGRERR